MQSRKQLKLLEEIKKVERHISGKDLSEYKMFVKRQKDEEEFDSLSITRLLELHEKYYLKRERKNFDQYFKDSDSPDPTID